MRFGYEAPSLTLTPARHIESHVPARHPRTVLRVRRDLRPPTAVALRFASALGFAILLAPGPAHAGCPREPVLLDSAGFALSEGGAPPDPARDLPLVELPDFWRKRIPRAGGLGWYRFRLPASDGEEARCAVYLPDVNMNAAVFVNGQWVGEGGSFEEPVAHNFNRPLYFEFPASLLRGGAADVAANRVDVLLFAYAHHFGRLGPIWVGPHRDLEPRYESDFLWQVTLAQIGTALAVVTAVFVGVIWVGSGFQPLYGCFVAATVAWAVNSLNYWVSAIPMSHWAWDRLVNGALDQFAVFLALFFHRVVRVRRPAAERALVAFSATAAVAALATPRPYFAAAMMATHACITAIGAYVTSLAWFYRRRLTRLEARVYLGAWLAQLAFSFHDLGIQLGLWLGIGYTLPYTVSCMMLAFGTTLGLRFVHALREARALNEKLEERVREREEELSRQFMRSRELERRDILNRERQRLMREMHDGLGGQLVSALALAETAETADADLAAALRDSLDELRLVIFSLDPGLSEVPPLLAALRGRLEPALERRGIRFRWRVGDAPTPERFGPEQLLSVLRIVQEAITNAVKHAHPSVIEVATAVLDGSLVILVCDDGAGMQEPVRHGRGLRNMERRAQELGGALSVGSDPAGTRIELRLPLE